LRLLIPLLLRFQTFPAGFGTGATVYLDTTAVGGHRGIPKRELMSGSGTEVPRGHNGARCTHYHTG
jgi:hypothetical protein